MTGNDTHDYDLAIEFSEKKIRELLGVIFDSNGTLCKIIDELEAKTGSIINYPCGAFGIDVLFDKPIDIPIPPEAHDLLDIRLRLGENGQIGEIRIVAGVDVDNTSSFLGQDFDFVRINFAEKTYYASATINTLLGPLKIQHDTLTKAFKDIFPSAPMLGIPVNRGSTEPTSINKTDVVIIDDKTTSNKNAVAILVTFGGGNPGNRQLFSTSYLSPDEHGGIAINFNWLCRIIRPKLADFFDVTPDSFAPPCRLVKTFRVDEEEEVDMTKLELTLVDGAIQISTAGKKYGTGYSADWSLSGSIKMEIKEGNLVIKPEMGEVQVETHISPWVWFVAVATGGIAGAVVGGPVGALVGAALGAIIVAIIQDTIEDKVASIAERVKALLKGLSLQVPAVGVKMIFDRITLDDIVIGTFVPVEDTTPIKSAGEILVANGLLFDLDSGTVGGEELCSADLIFEGSGHNRQLRTLCQVPLARTGETSFDNFNRLKMYSLVYLIKQVIPLYEIAKYPGFGEELFYKYKETGAVFAVRTDEGRYSLMQVVKVDDDYIRIKYKTYDKPFPSVTILGTFKPLNAFKVAEIKDKLTNLVYKAKFNPLPVSEQLIYDKATGKKILVEKVADKYSVKEPTDETKIGVFQARTILLKRPIKFEWYINSKPLKNLKGTVTIHKKFAFDYSVDEDKLTLTNKNSGKASFVLSVVATDKELKTATAQRCIEFASGSIYTYLVFEKWDKLKASYLIAGNVPKMIVWPIKKSS